MLLDLLLVLCMMTVYATASLADHGGTVIADAATVLLLLFLLLFTLLAVPFLGIRAQKPSLPATLCVTRPFFGCGQGTLHPEIAEALGPHLRVGGVYGGGHH